MKVRNINGTSDNECACGSWLKHWENGSRKKAGGCSAWLCSNPAVVGAHVQKEDAWDKSWYILPFCEDHNARRGESVDVYSSVEFVSANVSDTCGR